MPDEPIFWNFIACTASALTPNSFANNPKGSPSGNGNNSSSNNSTTINPVSSEEEFEHQFFILRCFVLGTIGCVFSVLVLMFWIYFMYLWRTWDSGMYCLASVRLLNFSLKYTKIVTPTGKYQHTLGKLWHLTPKARGESSKIGHIFTK